MGFIKGGDGRKRKTRFDGLRYEKIGDGHWRFIDHDGAVIGQVYPTRKSLIDDAQRVAELRGYADAPAGPEKNHPVIRFRRFETSDGSGTFWAPVDRDGAFSPGDVKILVDRSFPPDTDSWTPAPAVRGWWHSKSLGTLVIELSEVGIGVEFDPADPVVLSDEK